MNILSPLSNVSETIPLIKSGADELYCGILSNNWKSSHNKIFTPNQRSPSSANLKSINELKKVSELTHKYNKKVYLTLNKQYTKKEFITVKEELPKIINTEIDAIIVSDIKLIMHLNRIDTGINLHLSTIGAVFNSEACNFLKDYGIKKITFPRHIPINDMEIIIKKVKGVKFEAFILNGLCKYIEGFCSYYHGLEKSVANKDDAIRRKVKEILSSNFTKSIAKNIPSKIIQIASNQNWIKQSDPCEFKCSSNIKIPTQNNKTMIDCGACSIYDLKNAGVNSIKIVGRENVTQKKIEDVKFIKNMKKYLHSKDKNEFITRSKKIRENFLGSNCKLGRCYY